jgi:hypothetical protein
MINVIDGDVLLYMSIWGSNTLEEGKIRFKEVFNDCQNATFSDDYVMALGGPDNFRNDLYSEYKASASRVKSKSSKPDWFNDLKSWIVEEYEYAVLSDNCEADDLVRIWHLELESAGMPYCVVTVDKDLDCCFGNHYNPRTSIGNNYSWAIALTIFQELKVLVQRKPIRCLRVSTVDLV